MCIRDSVFPSSDPVARYVTGVAMIANDWGRLFRLQEAVGDQEAGVRLLPVSYTHLRAHETVLDLVCRLLLEKKKTKQKKIEKK